MTTPLKPLQTIATMTSCQNPDAVASPSSHPSDPFEGWAEHVVKIGDMSTASTLKYAPLWKAWRGWLLAHDLRWHEANAGVIRSFLSGPAPGTGGRGKPLSATTMSSYTRQRYWRLLRGVYANAVRTGAIENNPTLDVEDADRPTIARRDRQSQILEPQMFEALRKSRTLTSTIALVSEQDWWHVRDRAILAVLIATGMTSSELIALRGMDVLGPRRTPLLQPVTMDLEPAAKQEVIVDIMENSNFVGRTLTIQAGMAELVVQWARCREQLLRERSARHVQLAERKAFLQKHDASGAFFVSRRARDTAELLPPMEPVTLYYSVSQAMLSLRHKLGLEATDGPHVAKGPAVIRNSVIRRWLDTVGTEETLKRSGLKNTDSLRLIPSSSLQ